VTVPGGSAPVGQRGERGQFEQELAARLADFSMAFPL
jgi:hypothetical protein